MTDGKSLCCEKNDKEYQNEMARFVSIVVTNNTVEISGKQLIDDEKNTINFQKLSLWI